MHGWTDDTALQQLAGTTLTDADDNNFTRQAVDPGIALGQLLAEL